MIQTTNVLIAGAGPTGLMMACQLKRFGVDCIIVDGKPGITVESRALAVQARSIQIYEQMGLLDAVLEQGQPATEANFIVNGKLVQTLSLENVGKGISSYAFLFILSQDKNERILYDHFKSYGDEVRWSHELISFAQNDDGISAVVKDDNGREDTINAKWLVAADGARSFVRHFLQIPFDGATYENIFYVADTHADWPWNHKGLSLCFTDKTFAGLFPMKGENRFRLIGTLPKNFANKEVHSFDEIKGVIEEDIKAGVTFTNTNWFSVYKIHHRVIAKFRKNKVFLAGDAAHVHSPVGGQGMNTGLQDAYNLAWKLSLVLKNMADEKLLDSYNDERTPVAYRLVKTTDRAFSFVTSENRFLKFLRLKVFPVFVKYIMALKAFRLFAFRNVSQIAINYRNSFLSYNASGNLLRAGKLVPFVEINSKKIDEHLRFNGFTFLIFDCLPAIQDKEHLLNIFKVPMQFIIIARTQFNETAYKKFKVKKCGVFVIRPDNYIGFTSERFSVTELKKYFIDKMCLNAGY